MGVVIYFLGLVCNLNVTWYLIFKWTQIAGLSQWVHGVCACMLTHGVVGRHAQFTRFGIITYMAASSPI